MISGTLLLVSGVGYTFLDWDRNLRLGLGDIAQAVRDEGLQPQEVGEDLSRRVLILKNLPFNALKSNFHSKYIPCRPAKAHVSSQFFHRGCRLGEISADGDS